MSAATRWRRSRASRFAKYRPDQPRVPAGLPEGGQWLDVLDFSEVLHEIESLGPDEEAKFSNGTTVSGYGYEVTFPNGARSTYDRTEEAASAVVHTPKAQALRDLQLSAGAPLIAAGKDGAEARLIDDHAGPLPSRRVAATAPLAVTPPGVRRLNGEELEAIHRGLSPIEARAGNDYTSNLSREINTIARGDDPFPPPRPSPSVEPDPDLGSLPQGEAADAILLSAWNDGEKARRPVRAEATAAIPVLDELIERVGVDPRERYDGHLSEADQDPSPDRLYRGIHFDRLSPEAQRRLTRPGELFTEEGFVSATYNRGVAEQFTEANGDGTPATIIEITLPDAAPKAVTEYGPEVTAEHLDPAKRYQTVTESDGFGGERTTYREILSVAETTPAVEDPRALYVPDYFSGPLNQQEGEFVFPRGTKFRVTGVSSAAEYEWEGHVFQPDEIWDAVKERWPEEAAAIEADYGSYIDPYEDLAPALDDLRAALEDELPDPDEDPAAFPTSNEFSGGSMTIKVTMLPPEKPPPIPAAKLGKAKRRRSPADNAIGIAATYNADRLRPLAKLFDPDQPRDFHGRWVRVLGRLAPDSPDVVAPANPRAFAEAFARARARDRRTRMVTTEHDPSEYTATFLSEDGKTGVALIGDEVVNLFNYGGRGRGRGAVRRAKKEGGRRLDCVDEYLRQFYESEGFEVTGQASFDPKLAHPEWNVEEDGTPNIYFMALGAVAKADWDPSLHPRNPLGRFRSKLGSYDDLFRFSGGNTPSDFTPEELAGIDDFGDPGRYRALQGYYRDKAKLRRDLRRQARAEVDAGAIPSDRLDERVDQLYDYVEGSAEAFLRAIKKAPSRKGETLYRYTGLEHLDPETLSKIRNGERVTVTEDGIFATSPDFAGAFIIGNQTANSKPVLLIVKPVSDAPGINVRDARENPPINKIPEASFAPGRKLTFVGQKRVKLSEMLRDTLSVASEVGDHDGKGFIAEVATELEKDPEIDEAVAYEVELE